MQFQTLDVPITQFAGRVRCNAQNESKLSIREARHQLSEPFAEVRLGHVASVRPRSDTSLLTFRETLL